MWKSTCSLALGYATALLLVLLHGKPADGYPMPYPLPYPMPFPLAIAELGETGIPAAGCIPGYPETGYVPGQFAYGGRVAPPPGQIEFGEGRSMADVMQYPSNDYGYPQQRRSPAADYAGFGAPEGLRQNQEPEGHPLEDDTPMPGDAPASVDPGREPEPLLPGERLVPEDGPLDFDDTEIIPLAGQVGSGNIRVRRYHGIA